MQIFKPSWKTYGKWVRAIPVGVILVGLVYFICYNIVAGSTRIDLLLELVAVAIILVVVMSLLIGRSKLVIQGGQVVYYGVFHKKTFQTKNIDGMLVDYTDTTSRLRPAGQTIPTLFLRDKTRDKRVRLSSALYAVTDLQKICAILGLKKHESGEVSTEELVKLDPGQLYWVERHPTGFLLITVPTGLIVLIAVIVIIAQFSS